jgi:antitoxin (DNA-binding transcriptional repressor) of toxin-antitoxin stability system
MPVMTQVNVHEAKTRLSELLQLVKRGQVEPIAELIPYRKRNRLKPDPFLSRVVVKCDLTEPLTESDWEGGK